MTVHKAKRRALEVLGEMYASHQLPMQPSLFTPLQIDDELRETSPRSTAHLARLNGVLGHAEPYFAERLTSHEDRNARTMLLSVLETMRDATTAEPVATEREQWFDDGDVELIRAIVAVVAERARETLLAMNDGLSVSDAVFALRAEMDTAEKLLEYSFSTAGLRAQA